MLKLNIFLFAFIKVAMAKWKLILINSSTQRAYWKWISCDECYFYETTDDYYYDDGEVRSRYLLLAVAFRNFLNDTSSQLVLSFHFFSLEIDARSKSEWDRAKLLRVNCGVELRHRNNNFPFLVRHRMSNFLFLRRYQMHLTLMRCWVKCVYIFSITRS
jgi:hypothetical protein